MPLMQSKIDNLTKEIQDKKKELDELLERQGTLTPERLRAEALHEVMCNHNHTDGCSWYYGLDEFNDPVHKQYLRDSNRLFKAVKSDSDVYYDVIDVLESI